VVIGLGLLATLVVSLAGLLALGARRSGDARRETTMLWLARARLEQLQALAFAIHRVEPGITDVRTDTVTDLSRDPPALGGPGLRASPADSLERPHPGFEDHLDARGRWLEPGTDVARAVYTRRWRIRTDRNGGVDRILFDVVVGTSARMRRGDVTGTGAAVVHLSSAVARRAV
jgi:hypothetical protein